MIKYYIANGKIHQTESHRFGCIWPSMACSIENRWEEIRDERNQNS